jgi:hypothetical protein
MGSGGAGREGEGEVGEGGNDAVEAAGTEEDEVVVRKRLRKCLTRGVGCGRVVAK